MASKAEEIASAQRILDLLEIEGHKLNKIEWYKSNYGIAGWHKPDLPEPRPVASRQLPTLTKYFFVDNEVAYAAVRRVAAGEESIYKSEC